MSKKFLEEPKFLFPLTKIDVVKALNWYNQNVDYVDSLNWASEYISKHHNIDVSSILTKEFVVYGNVSRLLLNDCILPDNNLEWHRKKTQDIIDRIQISKKTTNIIQSTEKIVKKIDNTNIALSEIDSMLDTMITSSFTFQPKLQTLSIIKSVNKDSIINHTKKQLNEFQLALIDDDFMEGYSNFSTSNIKKIIIFFQTIITLFTRNVSVRKSRKKTKSQNILKHFKYQQSFSELNLISIHPQRIIGAKVVWIYNTKYKKIIRLTAKSESELSIHRSSIDNVDENLSKSKILRKPNEIIPQILDGGKIFLRDFFDKLKTKESKVSNRINEDCIILRIQ